MPDFDQYSAFDLREALFTGEQTPTEVLDHFLGAIEALNPTLHALTAVTADAARERAAALEADAQASGRPDRHESPLWGMPFADKDLNDRVGVTSTYGSAMFESFVAPASSQVVEDMDSAGGISVGKTNVPEFGFPAYAENRLLGGSALNPWDSNRDPGGSSSGAAVAVASGMLPFAPGNDAGGSVRIPAAACGLVGLKTSRGRVPGESGIAALAGLPVGGPIARTVADAALLLDGMVRGPDRYALRAPSPAHMPASGSFVDALEKPLGSLRIGWNTWSPWATDYEIEVDPAVLGVFEETLDVVREAGHSVQEVLPAPAPDYVESFRAVWMSSAASLPFPEEMLPGLEPLTEWLVRKGRSQPAANLPRALASLKQFEAQIIADYQPFDLILTPTLAMTARPRGWFDSEDGDKNFIQQCQFTPFTSYVNVAGLPAVSTPAGFVEENATTLPVGVQAIGRAGDEATLLRFAHDLEQRLGLQERRPPTTL